MLAAGGIAFENPTDAAAAYPQLWATRKAAKHALERGKLAPNPYHKISIREWGQLLRAAYQAAGQGRSPSIAWYDPALIPDPAATIAAMLGELAWCRAASPPTDPVPETVMPDVTPAAVARKSDADKLALRARLQAGRPADPDGCAPLVEGGYGDGLSPAVAFPIAKAVLPPSGLSIQNLGWPPLVVPIEEMPNSRLPRNRFPIVRAREGNQSSNAAVIHAGRRPPQQTFSTI
jgi:hypothetical protein